MKLEAVVFDLGGTLIEYSGPYGLWPDLERPGFEAAYGYLVEHGVALPDFEQICQTGFDMLPERWQRATRGEQNLRLADLLTDVLAANAVGGLDPVQIAAAAQRYQQAVCSQAHPLEHAQETLAYVREQGYKVGLLSNTMFTGAAHLADLRRFGLADYFDTLLFSADAGKWKPTAAPFLQVLSELAVTPETAVYIGDDPASDIVGGRRAGMRTIHIKSSQRFHTPDGVQPHAAIASLRELPPLLTAWRNGRGPG